MKGLSIYVIIAYIEKKGNNFMENYEELKRKYLDSRQECEEYFSTIQVQAEYIRQLESEIENLKSANSIDPDALLTIR